MKRPHFCPVAIWKKFSEEEKSKYLALSNEFIVNLEIIQEIQNPVTAHNLACVAIWEGRNG